MTLNELRREALQLDPSTRARLARELLESLDDLTDAQVEQLWLHEADQRHEQIVSGAVETVPMEEALSKARAARR
ncbi:MAG: addiction module protein [Actinobacteria bacterium]|nr:addiction module protein [Actinomycetota bacterium]